MARVPFTVLLATAMLVGASPVLGDPGSVSVVQLKVQASPGQPDVSCPAPPKKSKKKKGKETSAFEFPAADDVQVQVERFLAESPAARPHAHPAVGVLGRAPIGEPYRVGIWGDSHLASAVFTGELVRAMHLQPGQVRSRYIPATMGRPGVNLPLRRACVSPQWVHEAAHTSPAGAAAPGPGLVNLVSKQPGSTLSWDIRNGAGEPDVRQVRILLGQGMSSTQLAVSVDGGEEIPVTLGVTDGPAAIELVGDGPLSVIRLRLVSGTLRFHGLGLPAAPATAMQVDLFGWPGATVMGWKQARLPYLAAWFTDQGYDLVILEYGTNEATAVPFNTESYRASLDKAVSNVRFLFPSAACVLIAPGDRGVFARRVGKGKSSRVAAPGDTLKYTRIHEEVGRIQAEVAAAHRCTAWSMLDAMGGPGSAYRWARTSPALMSRDLIHFSPVGYRKLASRFATDLDWGPHLLGSTDGMASGQR